MLDLFKSGRIAELEKELETYRHAFETTRDDRDRLKRVLAKEESDRERHIEAYAAALEWSLANPDLLDESALPPMSGAYPRFVCVGARKCATSFLYGVTRQHPDILTAPKDAGSILTDYPIVYNAVAIDRPEMLEQIASLNPDARILICTRAPVERALSEYRMFVRNGRETRTFHEIVEAAEESGPFAYLRRSVYANDIARFCNAFEHVLVLSADDDMRENLWRLFSFMGIRDSNSLLLSASPPLEPARRSNGESQAEAANMTPEQQRLHDVSLTDAEREHVATIIDQMSR